MPRPGAGALSGHRQRWLDSQQRRAGRDPQGRQGLVHAPDRRNGSPPDQSARPMGRGGQRPGVRRTGDPYLASELRQLRQSAELRVRRRRQAGQQGRETCRHRAYCRAGLDHRRRETPVPEMPGACVMKRLALSAMTGASLLGCAAEPVQLEHNRSYILEWIGERPLMDYSHLTITLGEDGRAYGNGGCNHWFAPYTLEGDKLTFGKIGSTRKLCAPALMEQEKRFLQALENVQRWDVSPIEQIRFWPAEGKPLRWWLEEG